MSRKTMAVREFDILMSNPEYENGKYRYLEPSYFSELMAFVRDFQSYEDEADALEFMKIGYRKGVKDTISINNYVGLIELPSGYQIEILPKVDLGEKDDIASTRKVFLKMLKCLKDFEGKAFSEASLNSDRMNLYEVFISMYIKEAERLVKRDLKSSYNQTEDNLLYAKGKIDISKNIRENIAHKERLHCVFDEYSLNRAENRLIKATLLKLMDKSESDRNRQSIRRLLASFEMVDPSVNYDADFARVSLDRNSKEYSLLMAWSRIFLYGKSFTTFAGSSKGVALLFPMELVYEQYVAAHVKKTFGNDGWDVSAQDKGYYLFDSPRKFSLRPDIVISRNGTTIIMDTKWKRINANPAANFGISQSDMYQMYAYAKKYSKNGADPDVYLLYPYNDEASEVDGYRFTSKDGVNVTIRLLRVEDIRESLTALMQAIDVKENV